MVCGALRPGRQKGNARPGLGSHARAQRLKGGGGGGGAKSVRGDDKEAWDSGRIRVWD